ncbi:hypothetical protein PFICI_11477 [Pestalotiopsis fici W106-1]|uniref:Uncharacterized protein n=1 Tax=Pestalotiopsis fici (strain W106-1 / CGMCC3.15140) TaxID=1229662 RepID=W3WQD1_PESFW|nr:uncharacterized protein PFICI_11477 [Pestalotiopsis fici W106-1]ETS76090.1 hypothetical protein PFICI_11477 [Pestalotiopsis fici W106-1]
MSRSLVIIPLLATVAVADLTNMVSGWFETSMTELDKDIRDPVIDAKSNPTVTRSVKFGMLEEYWSSLPEDSVVRNSEWTWRVNISDVATPKVEDNDLADPHVVSTTYDFTWPYGDDLSEALDGANSSFCMSVVESLDLPVSVLNGYTEDDANSTSCVPALGQDCVAAILQRGAISAAGNGSYCSSPAEPWNLLSACKDSLGDAADWGMDGTGYALGGLDASSNETSRPWTNGKGFKYDILRDLNGSLSDDYLLAVNKLHILMFNAQIPTGNGNEYIGGPELHCMRVNTTQLEERDADGDGVAMASENERSLGTSLSGTTLSFSIGFAIVTFAVLKVL